MSLDIKAIRTSLIDSIQLSVGDLLSQQYNPELDESYGTVLKSRPNPEIAIPDYPYVVIDFTGIQDTDWYTTNFVLNTDIDEWQYETHKTLNFQISIFGSDSFMIGEQLATSYRRDETITLLAEDNIGIADVQLVSISPELLQTDFLEVSIVQMTVRVNDIYADPQIGSIENVILEGELTGTVTGEDLEIYINTST